MPSVIPGFRDLRKGTYMVPHIIVERDLGRFYQRIKDALSTCHEELVLIRFDTANDHHENTQIQSTKLEGYSFTQIISKALKDYLTS